MGLRVTVALVRHGESTWVAEGRFQGRGDPLLSTLGQRQAELVAARLASAAPEVPLPAHAPSEIWHSPLRRAAATAQAIAAARRPRPPLRPTDGLSEIDQGKWQGLTHAEVRKSWPSELEAWRTEPTSSGAPGGERLLDAQLRVRVALSEILAALEPAERSDSLGMAEDELIPWTIIVAHDGVLRLALITLLGLPVERFWSFPFALCGITVLSIADGRAALAAHNLADHLAPLATVGRPPNDRGGAL